MQNYGYRKVDLLKKIDGNEYVHERDYAIMVREYTSQLAEMQGHIDCLKAELAEVQARPVLCDCEMTCENLEHRHQEDCITINELQTTIDILVGRYAKLREMKGL